ncbi:maleylpyruvate isomerase N-terminal domain-containing protein [Rhodococcus aetherivorans]
MTETLAPARHYRELAAKFTTRVEAVPADRWDAPSPCEGWTARDVLRHVVDTQRQIVTVVGLELPACPRRTPTRSARGPPPATACRRSSTIRSAPASSTTATSAAPPSPRPSRGSTTSTSSCTAGTSLVPPAWTTPSTTRISTSWRRRRRPWATRSVWRGSAGPPSRCPRTPTGGPGCSRTWAVAPDRRWRRA